MKTRFAFWIVLCGVGSWLTSAVCASDPGVTNPAPRPVWYVLGLSPFLDAESKDPLFREIVRFLLEDAPLNSSVIVHDAFHVRTIARIDIPDLSAFRSAKTRANQFRDPIRKLKSFLAADPPRPNAAELDFDGAVRLPQFLDFVSENLGGADHELAVLVLGSPLYLDDKEPGFSMVDGYYPSDGHLTASREQSVYGIRQRAESLPGVTVHLGWFGDPWVSALHQEKIGRFWSLYLQGQGAGLGSFCGDLSTVFDALRGDAAGLQARATRYQLDPAQKRIEMLRITREIGVADWITRDTLPGGPQRPPTITAGVMKIGIRWKGDVDIDLYAQPARGTETLYFEHVRSPEGFYFKDHRSSPDREFEFIEFESPVNVWEVEAHINFYEGSAPGGAAGEVRIEFDGRIYSGTFQIAAEQGNHGRSGRGQERYWTAVDVPGVLKLREQAR